MIWNGELKNKILIIEKIQKMTTPKIFYWIILCQLFFGLNSCTKNNAIDNFYQHLGDTKNVQRLSPSHVLVLAVAANDIIPSDLTDEEIESLNKKGIDIKGKIITYDMSTKTMNSKESEILESFLDRDVPSFQIVNPKASLCHFSESKVSMEALVFLSWKIDRIGKFCLTETIVENFEEIRAYYKKHKKILFENYLKEE